MRIRSWCVMAALGLGLAGCRTAVVPTPEGPSTLRVTLHPSRERQTIHSFGASDAWSIQFVGRDWPLHKRERIAELLFSQELKPDGSPAGIGLSAWRFNIGAGSAHQGDGSGIRDEWRRAESFVRLDGGYDWSKHAGQRWFLRAAREHGVRQFIGFVNSPPLLFTRNGKAHSTGGEASNLAPDRYEDFAAFLRDVVTYLERNEGVRLDYVSPVNEPQWDWKGGQEGSPWLNHEIHRLVGELSAAFHAAGLETLVEIPEAGKLNYLYQEADRPGRGDQAEAFFARSSALYVGDLPNVAHKVAGHSYFTTHPADSLLAVRAELRQQVRAVSPELEFWMTEYCVLENNPEIQGKGRDLGMHTALYVARVIHADLTVAEASAWHWWLAVSPYDYKDGLIYIDRDRTDGNIYQSKLLWTLGHFSRFIRPGMRRIEVERSDEPTSTNEEVLVSAYRRPHTAQTVVVVVNQASANARVQIEGGESGAYDAYLTSPEPGDDLRSVGEWSASGDLILPPRSIVTLVSR